MFLFGTVKISNLINCCIIVNCMYLYLAHGTRRKAHGVFVSHTAYGIRHTVYGIRYLLSVFCFNY